jgi:hypothetical protein
VSDRLALAVTPIKLWHETSCSACGRAIGAGELAVRVVEPRGWIHANCIVRIPGGQKRS